MPWALAWLLLMAVAVSGQTPSTNEFILRELYPQYFGAKCDGSTDDSAAFDLWAAALGTAPERSGRIGVGTCVSSTPIKFGNVQASYRHVSVSGVSEDLSVLAYTGVNTGTFLQFRHNAYFTVEKLRILRSGTKGTTIGVLLDRADAGGAGTQTLTATFSHLIIDSWAVGMQVGSAAAASEIWCHFCQLNNNDHGWQSGSSNSLNLWFTALGLSGNGCGMYIQLDHPIIYGGHSASNTTAEFCMEGGSGVLSISGFRAEVASQFIAGSGNQQRIVVRDSTILQTGATAVLLALKANIVILENNWIQGQVTGTGVPDTSNFWMIGNHVIPGSNNLPATIDNSTMTGYYQGNVHYTTGLAFTNVVGGQRVTVTVDGATTFSVATRNHVTLACTGAETINTITGGVPGQLLYLANTDTECTLADDDDATATDAIDLTGTATSDVGAVKKILVLFYNGTSWEQISESDN